MLTDACRDAKEQPSIGEAKCFYVKNKRCLSNVSTC